MKKVMIILAMACFTGAVFAQKDPVSAAFEKYDGKEGFTVVTLSGDMLNMFTQAAEEKNDTTFQSKITSLRILVREKEKSDGTPVPDFKTEVYDKLGQAGLQGNDDSKAVRSECGDPCKGKRGTDQRIFTYGNR